MSKCHIFFLKHVRSLQYREEILIFIVLNAFIYHETTQTLCKLDKYTHSIINICLFNVNPNTS